MHNEIICFCLVKIGEKEYMEKLYNSGEVYLNSTDFFRTNTNAEIGDKFEGALRIKDGEIISWRENLKYEKLYCMWHIDNQNPLCNIYSHTIDEKTGRDNILIDFRKLNGFTENNDSYMVVIHNVKEFNHRLYQACRKLGVNEIQHKVVKYYDENTISDSEQITPFMKRQKYERQQEIRYYIEHKTDDALIINIGSIEDIAQICPVSKCGVTFIGDIKR